MGLGRSAALHEKGERCQDDAVMKFHHDEIANMDSLPTSLRHLWKSKRD